MKVTQIIASIQDEASGPSYSVSRLCKALAGQGDEVALHVLGQDPGVSRNGFAIHTHPALKLLPRLGISPALRRALSAAARTADIMHNHGLWMMSNVYPAWAVAGARSRLVCSPRGMLSPWALQRSGLLKKAMWALGQRKVIDRAACIHATGDTECADLRRLGVAAPIAVIPNGIDLPDLPPRSTDTGPRRLLFLGRLHPVKRIDVLLRAWREVERQAPDWRLDIAGPDEDGHRRELEALADELALDRVSFLGPVFGSAKSAAFAQADLFVLPSHSENFGMAVAEALAHGMPAIVSRGAPWAGLEKQQCGWWIDGGVAALVECLKDALARSPEELRGMGLRGRAWMERDFSWAMVGQMMHETYQWILGGGAPPPWVRRSS